MTFEDTVWMLLYVALAGRGLLLDSTIDRISICLILAASFAATRCDTNRIRDARWRRGVQRTSVATIFAIPVLVVCIYVFSRHDFFANFELATCFIVLYFGLVASIPLLHAHITSHDIVCTFFTIVCATVCFHTCVFDNARSTCIAVIVTVALALTQRAAVRLCAKFSDSFSFAEAVCLSQMVCVVLTKAAYTVRASHRERDVAERDQFWTLSSTRVEILLYAIAFGMVLIIVTTMPLMVYARRIAANGIAARMRVFTAFIVVVAVILGAIVTPIASHVMRVNCWLWTIDAVLMPRHRLLLAIWIALVVVAAFAPSGAVRVPLTVRRKYFHLISLCALLPPALLRSGSTDVGPLALSDASSSALGRLASGVALAALALLELIRFGRLVPSIDSFMRQFVDERDGGQLITTHLYLLLGCAAPLWIDVSFRLHPMAPFAGLLMVGVGDAAASTVGTFFGSLKWPRSVKSVQGTLGALAATLLSAFALNVVLRMRQLPHIVDAADWVRFAAATLIACIMEAVMTDIDNLVLPIVYLLAMYGTQTM